MVLLGHKEATSVSSSLIVRIRMREFTVMLPLHARGMICVCVEAENELDAVQQVLDNKHEYEYEAPRGGYDIHENLDWIANPQEMKAEEFVKEEMVMTDDDEPDVKSDPDGKVGAI
jgi:hypothetical protein